MQHPERDIVDGLLAGESYDTIAKAHEPYALYGQDAAPTTARAFRLPQHAQLIAELFRQRLLR